MRASEYVAKQVNSCQGNDQMDKIGEMYHLHFIRACEPLILSLCRFCLSDGLLTVKKLKGVTPSPSAHPSRHYFETKKEMMEDMLRQGGEAPQAPCPSQEKCESRLHATDHKISHSNNLQALVRDSFRCIVSGRYDSPSVQKNHELREEALRFSLATTASQCAHIFPQSTNLGISGSNEDGPKVRIHVPHLSCRQLLAPSTGMPRLCGLL